MWEGRREVVGLVMPAGCGDWSAGHLSAGF
jgi:hypothetical protein